MDERLSKMELARKSITRICKRLSWAFITFFVIYCLVVAAVTFVAIFPPAGFSYVGPSNALAFLPIVCNVFAGGFAIIVIARMLRTIGKGESPFSLSFARQIKVLAIVLLVGVVAGALITPGTQIGSMSESGAMVVDFFDVPSSDMYAVHIDGKGLLIAIICFALSPIFRYGALLQSEADDLM